MAAIQASIITGAAFGGLLLDHFSIAATLIGGSVLLIAGVLVTCVSDRLRPQLGIA